MRTGGCQGQSSSIDSLTAAAPCPLLNNLAVDLCAAAMLSIGLGPRARTFFCSIFFSMLTKWFSFVVDFLSKYHWASFIELY
jgi:hypothetical protein